MEHPPPDDKNWVWVLERPCPQCGYDATTVERDKLGALIRVNAAAWRGVLGQGDLVTRRPPSGPGQGPIWSALEYGCHVRDVYRLFEERLRRMLSDDQPTFGNWDQDAAAVDSDYSREDPSRVSYELATAAGKVADVLDRVGDRQWQRMGERADGTTFTVESLATYLYHDVMHHLWDAEAGLEALAESESSE